MRAHAERGVRCTCSSTRARPAAPRARTRTPSSLALDFVPALIARERERFGAYATRTMGQQLLDDLVAEEVRRARARSSRSTTRRSLLAPYAATAALPADARARAARALRFEDDGPTGAALLHDALRAPAPPLRREPAAEPLDPHGAARRRAVLLADRHRARAWRSIAGLELGSGVHLNTVAPERAAAELREA